MSACGRSIDPRPRRPPPLIPACQGVGMRIVAADPEDGDPPVYITRIVFERDEGGAWAATAETSVGDMVGTGATIREARMALDVLLKKANARAAPRDDLDGEPL